LNLLERMQATQKTVDAFKGKPFVDWRRDCIKLMGAHAKHMGHPVRLPKYNSAKTAAAAMKKLGFRTLADAMDANFTRISPDKVLLSDIVEMPGSNGYSSLAVAVGGGRAIGFHEELATADIIHPVLISGAWRIGPEPTDA
jgi:hypothetical protein